MDEQFIANRKVLNMKKVSHKNLIQIYNYFKSPDRVYLVMEMMSTTLASVMESTGEIEEYDASRIMKEIGDGLAYCHRKKLIHRDCKPENILISERDLKLGDFGVSTFEEGGTVCGTSAFMAPEMFLGESHSFVVDSWAMGCVLYEMLTAKRAFNGPVGRVEKKGDRWKIDTKISFSPDISEVLAGLLQFKPKYRWNMQQLLSSNWLFAQDEKREQEIT
ncbi:hypothetical protein GCK72_010299 [Caenorhabditis remanei]|uniref:Protein kinase domain-containing protein n=1 Tax=Caenorhabditis remanei TaxID=31234 RepID=A0A6A5H4B8_CAERE|nr:hypothetical protein GCK72_010299 [Caenorhabditis remanei]KAF1762037.1 hypothetical protein GCK72_010299 [Caenorhabditis remanei]